MRPLPVASPWHPAPVLYLRRTGSTMEEALRLYQQGRPGGTVVAAGYQRRGRGRREGRLWQAQAGRNLLFTIVLDRLPAMPPQRLPVLAGLAVALCLEEDLRLHPQVKWPNDVVHDGRKLAGVLCQAAVEAERRLYLVGIGLNCNQRRFPGQLAGQATSLARLLGRPIELWPLLEGILRRLAACLEDPQWKAKLLARLAGLGQPAALVPSGAASPSVEGTLEGVAEDGALLLRPAGAPSAVALYSAQLSLVFRGGAGTTPGAGKPAP